jgi:hypothetical protein
LRLLFLFTVIGCLAACARGKNEAPESARKFAVILQAGKGSHEGLARALHALLYSRELKEGGHSVALIFDGAGTEWAEAFRDPKHKLHGQYRKLADLGVIEEVCDYCAGAFRVKEGIKKMDEASLSAEFEGHPSLKKWADQGYQIIVL